MIFCWKIPPRCTEELEEDELDDKYVELSSEEVEETVDEVLVGFADDDVDTMEEEVEVEVEVEVVVASAEAVVEVGCGAAVLEVVLDSASPVDPSEL